MNQSPEQPPLIYRVSAAVKQLGVSRATVYRMIKAGNLDLIKISTRASGITRERIERHLNSQLLNS
ncbi:MAG: transcriptional regulator [Undibacterium sp.]|nr:transcriptional regulator [Undibacterium sp.]